MEWPAPYYVDDDRETLDGLLQQPQCPLGNGTESNQVPPKTKSASIPADGPERDEFSSRISNVFGTLRRVLIRLLG